MVTPYLVFCGRCSEALAFYAEAFQTEIKAQMPYGEYIPEGIVSVPPDLAEWVLHAEMEICGTNFWFADEAAPAAAGSHVRLTAAVPTARDARRIYGALTAGAETTLPPTETFYSAFHAALTDRFGIHWNIVAEEPPGQA